MRADRILLIESNRRIARRIEEALQGMGFIVWHDENGAEVIQGLTHQVFDLVLTSLNSPENFEQVQRIRQVFSGPCMVMSDFDGLNTQLRAYELGVDDFIVRPVDMRILQARVRACLRRCRPKHSSRQASSAIRVKDLTIDRKNRRVFVKDTPVAFSSGEFEVLWMLAAHPQQALSREFLFTHALGRPYDGLDRTIDRRVSRLRKKLNACSDVALTVRTVWGKGYMLAGK
ncbi:response regulator transcription factor [Microbulbifer elongatus]|uniref:Response regulator transcription factor n=1 Tax=Microbulbifer elongatus TaxID=86173 RepID=A0ABT1NWA4_9GAMM|nr:response regulator transcription factor [Microbulbifer elongatus]MCQ3828175.1 response regulator transcription factor [Microbulbifer elongatus]